jgi:hypothetical protein
MYNINDTYRIYRIYRYIVTKSLDKQSLIMNEFAIIIKYGIHKLFH